MKDDGYGEIKYRAQHSPMVYSEFKDGRGLGRWEDAVSYQLRNFLEKAGLTEAAAGVYDGFVLTVAGMQAVTMDFLKIPGGVCDNSKVLDKLTKYKNWQKLVIRKYSMARLSDCMDVICHEKTLAAIDAKRGTKFPHARNDLIAALMLYQDARGFHEEK